MKIDFLKFALAFFAVSVFLANCAVAQNIPVDKSVPPDLSTAAGVIAELQKIIDGKRAEPTGDEKLEAKRKLASRLEAKNVCIKRFKDSAKVIVIGFFAYDIGCRFNGAFIGSRYFDKTEIEMHKNALEAFGWQKASGSEREKLALLWVEKGLLAFFTVLYKINEDLRNQDFHAPQVVSGENGAVKVTLWIQLPPRMRREKGFQHVEYRFAGDGSFTGTSTLANLIAEN